MSTPEDVVINVKILASVTGAEEVGELAKSLEKINTVSAKVSTGVSNLAKVARSATPIIEGFTRPKLDPALAAGINELAKDTVTNTEFAGRHWTKYLEIIENASEKMLAHIKTLRLGGLSFDKFVPKLRKNLEEMRAWEELFGPAVEAMEKLRLRTGYTSNAFTAFNKDLISLEQGVNILNQSIKKDAEGNAVLLESYKALNQPITSFSQGVTTIFRVLRSVSVAGLEFNKTMEYLGGSLKNMMKQMEIASPVANDLIKIFKEEGVFGLKVFLTELEKFHRPIATVSDAVGMIQGTLDKLNEAGFTSSQIWKYWSDVFKITMNQVGIGATEFRDFRRALLTGGVEPAKEMIAQLGFMRIRLREISEVQRRFMASIGATGVVMREFTRDIFWAGLGMMFTAMSIARMTRREVEMERQSWSLTRSAMSLSEAQREYNEILFEYGAGSEEARQATIRVKEAQFALKATLESARQSAFQYAMSWGMLIFGAFPTMIRTGLTVMDFLMKLSILQGMAGDSAISASMKEAFFGGTLGLTGKQATGAAVQVSLTAFMEDKAGDSAIVAAGKTGILSGMMNYLQTSSMGAAFAMSVVLGIGTFLVGTFISLAIAQAYATSEMERMKKEMRNMMKEIEQGIGTTKSWEDILIEDSLVSALKESTTEVKSLGDEVKRLELAEIRDIEKVITIFPIMEEIEVPELQDITQNIYQELIETQIPEVPHQEILQVLVPYEIPEVQDQTQFIFQTLGRVMPDIPIVEDQTYTIYQLLEEIEIPVKEDMTQTIIQELREVEIPTVENVDQIIRQHLRTAEIPEVEIQDIVQTITQRLIQVPIPDVEDMRQIIEQELIRVNVPTISDQRQRITQEFIPVDIPEASAQYQEIIQELTLAEYPTIEDKIQYITQILRETEIPRIRDKTQIITQVLDAVEIPIPKELIQSITQELDEADITEPRDIIQTITQRLIEARIPIVDNIVQEIRQRLEEVDIPRVEDIRQRITQVLDKAEIPNVPDLTQRIIQEIREVRPTRVEDLKQIIRQELIEVQTPEIEDLTQIIVQQLQTVEIPNIRNMNQLITQELIETRIPRVENLTQQIIQSLVEVDIMEPRNMEQIITQELIQAEIPEIELEDVTQRIVQELQTIEIPSIKNITQTITQILNEVDIPNVEDMTQTIVQNLKVARIPEVEDQKQIISQELIKVFIPMVDDLTQSIVQTLEPIEISPVSNQQQIIEQILHTVEIPIPEDITQDIKQRLIEVRIFPPNNLMQTIEQTLIEAEIPVPENMEQLIIQRLVEIGMLPEVRDLRQTITQYLNPAFIPQPEVLTQEIRQELDLVTIPEVEDKEQEIVQILIPTTIPEILDKEQVITQILIPTTIPELPMLTQVVTQELVSREFDIEGRKNKLMLTGIEDLSFTALDTTRLVGESMTLRNATANRYRTSSLMADEFVGDISTEVESGGAEIQYLSFISTYQPYLRWLEQIAENTRPFWVGEFTELKSEIKKEIDELKGMRSDFGSPNSVYVKPVEPMTAPQGQNIFITINYPVIREEKDISILANEIKRIITKDMFSVGGRY